MDPNSINVPMFPVVTGNFTYVPCQRCGQPPGHAAHTGCVMYVGPTFHLQIPFQEQPVSLGPPIDVPTIILAGERGRCMNILKAEIAKRSRLSNGDQVLPVLEDILKDIASGTMVPDPA